MIGIATLVAIPSPASAVTPFQVIYSDDDLIYRGTGYWSMSPAYDEPGDAVKACDGRADGWGIEAQIDIDPSGATFHVDRVATTRGHTEGYCSPWATGNIRENTPVNLRVCKVKGTERHCLSPHRFYA